MTNIVNITAPIDLLERYKTYTVKLFEEKHSLKPMVLPKIEKIVITTTLGGLASDKNYFKLAFENIALISGQQPVITKAKKSVALIAISSQHEGRG